MRKSSENKMLSKSASELKIEWSMYSKEVKILVTVEWIIVLMLTAFLYMIEVIGVNPDITLEIVAKECAVYAVIGLMAATFMMFHVAIHNQIRNERKKKGFKPSWHNEDLDILEDEMLQLEARIKKLEERRY